ncbi:MAG TPA: hypothetical protein VN873_17510 [Candidatus Angelobacter sp.]|nr:hypothetical protein [Candidatus Angelobacter sp.]
MKTLTVHDYQRVRLPDVKPRQVFAHEKGPDGRIILTPVAPKPAKVHFEKRGKYTVAVTDRPFDMEALKQALAEFP